MTSLFHPRKGFQPQKKARKPNKNITPKVSAAEKQPPQEHTSLAEAWIHIESLSHKGQGVGVYPAGTVAQTDSKTDPKSSIPKNKAGKKVFVRGALAGEQAQISQVQQHAHYDEAVAIQIENPSMLRAQPPCEYYEACGGCQLQHLNYQAQVAHKLERLQTRLAHELGVPVTDLPFQKSIALEDKAFGYRRRARLSMPKIKSGASSYVGFRAAESTDIVKIDHCLVLHPLLNTLLAPLNTLLKTQAGQAVQRKYGHIELVLNEGLEHSVPAVILRLLKPFTATELAVWQVFSQQQHCDVIAQYNEGFEVLASVSERPLELGYLVQGKSLTFGPNEFIQVNAAVNEQIVQTALSWLQLADDEVLLELFAGFGNLTFALAERCVEIQAVELADLQVQRGRANAARLSQAGLSARVTFTKADLSQPLPQSLLKASGYDALVLDPPRAGAEQVMQHLSAIQAKKILYISCDQNTFIRDTKEILKQGYQLKKITLLDMFPQTYHAESIALFEQQV